MADAYETVASLRALLQAGEGVDGADRASAYAAACSEANDRLSRCARLLRQGLHTEAIQLAEFEPDLLGLLATLDFPERPEWDSYVSTHLLDRAPSLLIDEAQALNEAYAQIDPLREWLRRHRRLALARAPLAERIEVLRQIARSDFANSIWSDDLRLYERARLREVSSEIQSAASRGDRPALDRLVEELERSGWLVSPDSDLLQSARLARSRVDRVQARQTLEALVRPLADAFEEMSLDEARQLRQQWNFASARAHLPADDPLANRVAPALAWLQDEDQRDLAEQAYRADLTVLAEALEEGVASRGDLEAMAEDVNRHARGLPEDVESIYHERLDQLERAAARRFRWMVGASTTLILLVGVVVSVFLFEQAHHRNVASAVSSATELLDAGQVEQAALFLEDLAARKPRITRADEVRAVLDRLRIAREEEQARRRKFADALEAARDAPVGDEVPLKAARDLARTEAEQGELSDLAEDRRAALDLKVRTHEQQVRRRIAPIAEKVADLEKQAHEAIDSPVLGDQVRQLKQEADKAAPPDPLIGESVRRDVASLVGRLDRLQADHSRALQQQEMQRHVTSAVPATVEAIDGYVKSLQAYLEAFPDDSRASDFKRALTERPSWSGPIAWSQALGDWKRPYTQLEPQRAGPIATECETLLRLYPNLPNVLEVREYRDHVQAIAARITGAKSLQERMENFISPSYRKLSMIGLKDGKHYYFEAKNETRMPSGTRISYLLDPTIKTNTKVILKRDILYNDLSPLAKVADEALVEFQAKHPLEQTTLSVAQRLVDNRDLDPILKYDHLQKLLLLGSEGSYLLKQTIEPLVRDLARAKVDLEVNWLDPDNRDADAEREKASSAIKKLPTLTSLTDKVRKYQEKIESAVDQRWLVVGWLARDDRGAWQCLGKRPESLSGPLLVLVTPPIGPGVWKQVGTIEGGAMKVDGRDPRAMVEGRLVFIAASSGH